MAGKLPRKKPNKTAEVLVKGVADHVTKQGERNNTLAVGECRVGCSKGVTLNMGNYQSARIDFWMERVVEDNEHEKIKAYSEMVDCLDDLITQEVDSLESEKS